MLQPKNLKNETIDSSNFKMMIYGESDSGKTSALRYLPGKTIVCDLDSSSIVLNGTDIDVITKPMLIANPSPATMKFAEDNGIQIDSPRCLLKTFYQFCVENINSYDSIVIDNFSAYQRDCEVYWSKHLSNKMQVYGKLQQDLLDTFFEFLKLDKNIIFTAWRDTATFTNYDNTVTNRYVPKIREKILDDITGNLNVVAYAEKVEVKKGDETKVIRGFRLSSTPKYFAKNQLDDRTSSMPNDLFKFGEKKK